MCDIKLNYFILCYNRSTFIPTLSMLHNYGIFDDVYLVVGKDDPQLDNYTNFEHCNLLVFDKYDFLDKVDSIGSYNVTKKICTYARAFIDEYAKINNLQYICILFDDIESVQLRYVDGDVVRSTKNFDLKMVFNEYVKLLNLSTSIYMVGPPGSSYYIGCNTDTVNRIATHYGNILIYDINKPIGPPYKANVLEDMMLVLENSKIGHIGLFPFGLQVNCRPPKSTNDAYVGISKIEYAQQWMLAIVDDKFDRIPYSRFIPKIISDVYKKR